MTILTEPLRSLKIDQRNEEQILEAAKARVREASGGLINDFSLGSPATALLEGQVFAQAELTYVINKLPRALVIEFLKLQGVERIVGSSATALITYRLTAPQATTFYLQIGYSFFTQSGQEWKSTELGVIQPGNLFGTVAVESVTPGAKNNVAARQITRLSVPLSFLASATNAQPAAGGLDPETDEEFFERAFETLWQRPPMTKSDYESITRALLGQGARVQASSPQFGRILLRVLSPGGALVGEAQITQLQQLLQGKSLEGVDVEVINFIPQLVDIGLTLQYSDLSQPAAELDIRTAEAVKIFFYDQGPDQISIRELEYSLRTLPWIGQLTGLEIDGSAVCNDRIPLLVKGSTPVGKILTIKRGSEERQYDLAIL